MQCKMNKKIEWSTSGPAALVLCSSINQQTEGAPRTHVASLAKINDVGLRYGSSFETFPLNPFWEMAPQVSIEGKREKGTDGYRVGRCII